MDKLLIEQRKKMSEIGFALLDCTASVQHSQSQLHSTPEGYISFTCGGFFYYHLAPYSQSPFCRKRIPHALFPALYPLSCSCNFSSLHCAGMAVILPVFTSISSHVFSLCFPHSSVCSEDGHTSLSIPLSGGSLMHEQAPTSAPRGSPLLTSHRYPICIHLSPLSNLSNLGY